MNDKVEFKPELNTTKTIVFEKDVEDAGFTVLLKGGLFHTFPKGYVVTKNHCDLLDEAGIPYRIVND